MRREISLRSKCGVGGAHELGKKGERNVFRGYIFIGQKGSWGGFHWVMFIFSLRNKKEEGGKKGDLRRGSSVHLFQAYGSFREGAENLKS